MMKEREPPGQRPNGRQTMRDEIDDLEALADCSTDPLVLHEIGLLIQELERRLRESEGPSERRG